MSIADLKHLDTRGVISDITSLDFENAADWSLPVKAVSATLVFLAVFSLGYVLSIRNLNADYRQLRQRQAPLLSHLEKQATEARDPAAYRQQLAALEQQFGALTDQLPKTTEMPALLEDISRIGLAAGLKFRSIALQDEKDRGFYAALPIRIEVVGSYHALGAFVSGIAALPRIVTLHDFVIEPAKDEQPSGRRLAMVLTARTYRYLGTNAGSTEHASDPQTDTEVLPPFHPVAAFAYQAQALRSPFVSTVEGESPARPPGRSSDRSAEYLERFALDALTLVGTISRQGVPPEALIEDPTGLVTRVWPGSHLGEDHGRVVAVFPGRVALVETIVDGRGKRVERPQSLALGKNTQREKSTGKK